ncbi:MAG TPA: DUF4440 domain-containing protein [Gemmatimonadaceae bacterium]|nr:DUF4440 domain-containing protein [Gemmatimonadaceae bacterium]
MATLTPPTDLHEGIRTGIARWVAAFEGRNAAEIAACYTEDAQLLPANSDEVRGRAAIEEFWRSVFGLGLTSARLETLEADGLGNTGYEVGRYTLLGEGGQEADHGKYIVIWRQVGDRWLLHRDIWTTSVPAQPAK